MSDYLKSDMDMTLGGNAPKVNPLDYPSDKCSKCGNEVFVPGVIFKTIPGVIVGNGKDDVQVPLKVFVCSKCGELSDYDKKILNAKEEKKSTNLII